jgi:pimeloyl-ACP methyl ester carboxylesterase
VTTFLSAKPTWFEAALSAKTVSRAVSGEDGAEIRLKEWGSESDRSPLVLVHGSSAHAGWWDHIAPPLAQDRLVVALDLPGHGDSSIRDHYDYASWAADVAGVAKAVTGPRRPIVVGHSLGGLIALMAAHRFGLELTGVIAIDAGSRHRDEAFALELRRRASVRSVYPDRNTAIGRFRLRPPQRHALPYVLEHLAENSVRRSAEGWTWRFDPRTFDRMPFTHDRLAEPLCPAILLRAEYGRLTASLASTMQAHLSRPVEVRLLREAGHHPMVDQPLALIEAVTSAVATLEVCAL